MPAFYINSIKAFIDDDPRRIVGILTSESGIAGFYQQQHTQTLAWGKQINILKECLSFLSSEYNGSVLLEYPIPRRAKRIDTVLLVNNLIFVIEFKIGAMDYYRNDKIQVEDYCLDLRDFHKESRDKVIVPILVASDASPVSNEVPNILDNVHSVLLANGKNLHLIIRKCIKALLDKDIIDLHGWNNSQYLPTPTIIEAAQHIYSGKNVKEISRSQAGADNLSATTNAVIEAIRKAKDDHAKTICFITGVPGAGKTLAGLNIVHSNQLHNEGHLGVFLSGNGPLVQVLCEALARDNAERTSITIGESRRKVSTFIQNVHNFLDAYFYDESKVPIDNVVLFDEAQRAWNSEQSKRKFNRDYSEPEMMLSIMDRHQDWAVIVALIGGGQEINTGEAGLAEWGRNLADKFPHWRIYISPELKEGHHSTAGHTLFESTPEQLSIYENSDLHLKVSIRSYKAELLSHWVGLFLDGTSDLAHTVLFEELNNYPILFTRDLNKARSWLKKKCRGSRRGGLIASSGARRIRPYGLDVTSEIDVPKWFLEDVEDIRSSSFLEIPATEFAVQGLELDWTCLCWGLDLRRTNDQWAFFKFVGTKWQNVNKTEMKQFILNKYRVLLTRAREGIIIWVPEGDHEDRTRDPELYSGIVEYLKSCGIKEI